jgi:hypothetical protein
VGFKRQKFDAQCRGRRLHFLDEKTMDPCIRQIHKDRHAGGFRTDLLEQLQPFATELRAEITQSGDIATRPGKTSDEAKPNRIGDECHDNRDSAGCILGGLGQSRAHGYNHGHLSPTNSATKLT